MCERAREWASLGLDGELSELERVLLDAHTRRCAAAPRTSRTSATITDAIRAAEPRAAAAARRDPAPAPHLAGDVVRCRGRRRGRRLAVTVGLALQSARRTRSASRCGELPAARSNAISVGPELRERRAAPRSAASRNLKASAGHRSQRSAALRHRARNDSARRGDYAVAHDDSRFADHLALLKPRPCRPGGGRARVPPPPRGEP